MNLQGKRLPALLVFFALLLWLGCGGNSSSSNNTGTGTGSGNGAGSGSGNPGSSNPGSTGGSGSSGSGGNGPTTTYLYAGGGIDQGSVHGYQLNSSTGAITEVLGSPYSLPKGLNTGGEVTAVNGYVYTVNRPEGVGGALIYSYKVDPSNGSLTEVGSGTVVTSTNYADVRGIVLSDDNKYAFLWSQFGVTAVALSSGSPVMLNSQELVNGATWGFAVAGNYAYAGVQSGNPKTGFQDPVIERLAINTDGTLGTPQTVVTLSDSNIPYDLVADPNGKFLAATTGFNNNFVTVWSINSNTGGLTEAPGAPFSNSSEIGRMLRFDPSGTHLYLVNNPSYEPRPEDVMVFNVDGKGSLSLVQTLDLDNEVGIRAIRVSNDFVYLVNNTGSVQSNIVVLHRDNSTGQVAVANKNPISDVLGGLATLQP